MKYLKLFEQFFSMKLNESYLESGRQPLYHITDIIYLIDIILDDILKAKPPSFQIDIKKDEKSISLTRSNMFTHTRNGCRIVLDSNKLKHNHTIIPVEEFYILNKSGDDKTKSWKYKKFIPNKNKYAINKIYDYDNENGMPHEYEERCFKDITKLGKYIISLQFYDLETIKNAKYLERYIEKYPHISIELIDIENSWKKPLVIKIEDLITK